MKEEHNTHIPDSGYPISYHYTWRVWDASKLTTAMSCMRKAFYEYFLGWRPEGNNKDLIFGTCWHLAMDYIYRHGIIPENIDPAMEVFEKEWRIYYEEWTDLDMAPKNPGYARIALESYVKKFRNDEYKVFEIETPKGEENEKLIEVAGSVPISDKWTMTFKIDKVLEHVGTHKILVRDHKTSGVNSAAFRDKWSLMTQPNLYSHVILCLFDIERITGTDMDVTFFRKSDADKKADRHLLLPVRRTREMVKEWLWNTLHWLEQVEWNVKMLQETKDTDDIMRAFPKNENACTKFNRMCPYMQFCKSWPNPIREAGVVPFKFQVDRWDPREIEEKAGKVYHFEKGEVV